MIRWIFAAIHLLALGLGLGAVWSRGRALRDPLDAAGIRRVLYADNWWGVAFLLWVVSGLARAFGGLEKGAASYIHTRLFLAKMAALGLILILEIWPMATFIRWRMQLGRGESPDVGPAPLFAGISAVQAALVVLMVLAATAVARGYGIARP